MARSRSETVPGSMRSRIDSTSARMLRTLTNTGPATVKRFEPPADEMDEIASTLWSSLEHWFELIKDEIRKVPETTDSNIETEKSEPDQSLSADDNQNLDTRLIASELVRSKRVDVSVRPRSTASLESIRMSQPAVEFNMTRQCGEHGMNRGLYRDISRRLYQSFTANQEGTNLFNQASGVAEESSNGLAQWSEENSQNDESLQSPVYENASHSRDSDCVSLVHACSHDTDLEGEYLASFASGHLESSEGSATNATAESNATVHNTVRNEDQPIVGRSISYTNAIGDNSAQEGSVLAARAYQLSLSQSLSRSLSVERHSTESSQSSEKENEEVDRNDKDTMVERFADRLCAVVHGYHLISYSRPYWESAR